VKGSKNQLWSNCKHSRFSLFSFLLLCSLDIYRKTVSLLLKSHLY